MPQQGLILDSAVYIADEVNLTCPSLRRFHYYWVDHWPHHLCGLFKLADSDQHLILKVSMNRLYWPKHFAKTH